MTHGRTLAAPSGRQARLDDRPQPAAPPAAGTAGPERAAASRGRRPAGTGITRGDRLAGLDPAALVDRFGSPCYVYDLAIIRRQADLLRSSLPPAIDLAYAVKANPALAVVAYLGGLGLGADVASAGELETARRAGIDAGRIVMTGPGKGPAEHRAAVAAGVRAVTVESPGELDRLERTAAEAGRPTAVLLRASTVGTARLERTRVIGDDGAGKFGMDAGDLRLAARAAAASPHLDLLGLHRFGASNVTDAGALAAHVEETVDLAVEIASAAGVPLRLVDAGGGLGIPYDEDAEALDVEGLGRRLARLAERWAAGPATRRMRLLLEPGRFLVGPAGAYVTRVVDRKRVGETHVVIVDGGIHHLLRPSLVGEEQRVRLLGPRARGPRAWPVTVAGSLCSGLDVLAAHAGLPLPEAGDLLAVLDAGAYGFTEAMPLFLSHPVPAEIAVLDGRAELIRPRQEPREWLERQLLPAW